MLTLDWLRYVHACLLYSASALSKIDLNLNFSSTTDNLGEHEQFT